YSYDPNQTIKTSGVLAYGLIADLSIAGSHAGQGGHNSTDATKHFPIFDDYKNPQLPGGGGGYSNGTISNGGGVVTATVTGSCTVNSTASINASGINSGYLSGAGGTINLTCASFAGTGGTATLTANGSGYYGAGGGGGGMIRLKATGGNTAAFAGCFTYPYDSLSMSSFLTAHQARGGGGMATLGNGAAGTIFLEHTGSTYGDLIVSNKGVTSYSTAGFTHLRSIQGTLDSGIAPGATSLPFTYTATQGSTAAFNNLNNGITLRAVAVDGTPDYFLDDKLFTVSAHGPTSITTPVTAHTVAGGTAFRSVDFLDHLWVGDGAELTTYGDIYPVNGNLITPGTTFNLEGFLYFAGTNPGKLIYNGLTAINATINSTNGFYRYPMTFIQDFTVTGKVQTNSNITVNGNLSLTGSGNMHTTGIIDVSGNMTVNSSTPVAVTSTKIIANNLTLTAGSVSHPVNTTTNGLQTLVLVLSGNLLLNGGSINLNALGYNGQYSYDPTVAAGTSAKLAYTLVANTTLGGSHAGQGGSSSTSPTTHLPVFDNYRDPRLPGGGTNYGVSGGIANGGGVVIAQVTGSCTVNTPSTITATGNGSYAGGAGGTINLTCASFAGTAGAAALNANGGGYYGSGGGGGGMIRLKATGGSRAAFSGNFTYPFDTTSLTAFLNVIQARGGAGSGTLGNGAAGTIFLEHNTSVYGDLLVSNGSVSPVNYRGKTKLPDFYRATDTTLNSIDSATQATFGINEMPGFEAIYANQLIHVWDSTITSDPRDMAHVEIFLDGISPTNYTGNTASSIFTTGASAVSGNDFSNLPAATSYKFRTLHKFDSLYIGTNVDLVADRADVYVDKCSIINSASTSFIVPATSSISVYGLSSNQCIEGGLSGTITKTSLCLNDSTTNCI
ncbi:MAG TPA: hypothetical protein VNJ08_00625, partial [Bacteriovoracaceae bacterium]|nr:hypothetical protein [Bacteriovoracaceae bacterium]